MVHLKTDFEEERKDIMGTLWKNGVIYTMQEEGHTVEAVFTEGGVIKGLGSSADLEKRKDS